MRTLFIDQIFKRSKMLKGIFLSNLQSGIRILYGDKSSLSSDFFYFRKTRSNSMCFYSEIPVNPFQLAKVHKINN